MSKDEPKIIVDDDWKAQAQAEKDRLASEQKTEPDPAHGAPGAGKRPELPPATFATLITTMASQTLFALGIVPDPHTQQPVLDLDLARFHIDTLKVIEEKTVGNLTEDEKKLLDSTVYEMRSHYIRVSQQTGM